MNFQKWTTGFLALLCFILVFIFDVNGPVLSIGLPEAKAQSSTEVDESFDPFSDYNEFEQDVDEEADINFFKNGRMLTLALSMGFRGFTDGFSQAFTPALNYGVQFVYFFDLQSAISIGYLNGDHSLEFNSYRDDAFTIFSRKYTGSVNVQILDVSYKYYFNTENVTRGLADLNPYVSAGAAYFIRTYALSEELALEPDRVVGAKLAAGIEIPLMRRRGFLGVQGSYNYVQFPDENNRFIEEFNQTTGETTQAPVNPRLNGDIFDLIVSVGINF